MSYSDLTPEVLRELLTLVEKKESLLAEIAKIDSSIASVFHGDAPVTKPAHLPSPKEKAPKATKVKRTAKPAATPIAPASGSMAERISSVLTGKPEGLSVPEIAKLTGAKPASLHVFFATTGKTKGFVKVGRGVWACSPAASVSTPVAPEQSTVVPEPIVEAAAPAAEPTPELAAEPAAESVPPAPELPTATVQPEFATQH